MKAWRWLRWLPVVALVLYLLTGVVQVRPGERGVVRRFGRILAEKPEPGLWIGLPWGMDRIDRVEVDKLRQVSVGYSEDETGLPSGQFLTGDHNLVNVRVTLSFRVRADEVGDFVTQGSVQVEGILGRELESSAAEWVASRPVDDVLLAGKLQMRQEVIERVAQRVRNSGLGVEVLDARVEQIAPPDEVKDAFDDVSRAQTRTATLRLRAEQETATRERIASAERYRIDQSAQAYAEGTKLLARQDAERFRARLVQYELAKNKPAYLHQVWQEERGRVLQKLKEAGAIDLLDHRLGEQGLELFTAPGKR